MGFMKKRPYNSLKRQKKIETYYDDVSISQRSMVIWLDSLLMKPEDLFKMHEHHIHTMEMRGLSSTPFHKDKKIDAWIRKKINTVVSTYRTHKYHEEHTNDFRRSKV